MVSKGELPPGRVYAFAIIVSGSDKPELVTLNWFKQGYELEGMRRELDIKFNPNGYGTYSWNTLDAGPYEVSLSDQKGSGFDRISFNVK